MKTVLKLTTAVALAGALAVASTSPSQARHGRNAALIGGIVAGTVLGAAIASSPYYDRPAYGYAEPGYYYAPGPVYYDRGGAGYNRVINGQRVPSCATDGGYGRIDYSAC